MQNFCHALFCHNPLTHSALAHRMPIPQFQNHCARYSSYISKCNSIMLLSQWKHIQLKCMFPNSSFTCVIFQLCRAWGWSLGHLRWHKLWKRSKGNNQNFSLWYLNLNIKHCLDRRPQLEHINSTQSPPWQPASLWSL